LISSTTVRAGGAQVVAVVVVAAAVTPFPTTRGGAKEMTAVPAATAAEGANAGGGWKDIKDAGGADGRGWNVVLAVAGTLEAATATKSCNSVSHSLLSGIPMSERLWFELAIKWGSGRPKGPPESDVL
jgi:hypothetical protein